jgi:anti-anti-sigma regulatory factor
MLKISVIESRGERPLILEGKLLAPWAAELRTACEKARADLQKRELVIDLKNLTAIGQDVLLELMNERVNFHCGVFSQTRLAAIRAEQKKP